jgi:CO/xanthine dehydrogenase Mo-binding subunit
MNDVIELPNSTSLGAIGQPLRRKEDERLLTGRGRFSDDFTLPGQSYAVVVRSPHPHARIVEIDTRRALAMPGQRRITCRPSIRDDEARTDSDCNVGLSGRERPYLEALVDDTVMAGEFVGCGRRSAQGQVGWAGAHDE